MKYETENENELYEELNGLLDAERSEEQNKNEENVRLKAHTLSYSLSDNEKMELESKINELRKFCVMHNVPFLVAAAYENNKLDTSYIYECLTAYDTGRTLKKDDIAQLILIKNGFKAIPKQKF